MIGSKGQTTGTGSQAQYEAVILDFLNKEMAVFQLTPQGKDSSDDLDALVSDLLKQVMTESDQPQPLKQSKPVLSEISFKEYPPLKTSAPSNRTTDVDEPDHDGFNIYEDRDQMLAEFMAPQEETAASPDRSVLKSSESGFDPFEKKEDPLAEYMRLQETRSAEGGESKPDSSWDSSQFERMDDVLAEYMPLAPVTSVSENETGSIDLGVQSSQFDDGDAVLPEQMGPPTEAHPAVAAFEVTESMPEVSNMQNAPAESAGQLPERESAVSGTMDSAPVNKPSSSKTADSLPPVDAIETAPYPDTNEIKSPANVLSLKEKIPSAAKHPEKTATKSTPLALSASLSQKSRAPLIAVASLCLLAAVGIPGYFFSGAGQKPEGSGSAAATSESNIEKQIGASGELPAIPILQVSPKYPESAIKSRISTSVVLELNIDSEGSVTKATPISGSELFHESAVKAAMKWRYKPASVAGKNIASKSRVTLNFNLKN